MKYRVEIEGQTREVDVQITPGGAVSVSLDGEPVDADVRRIPGGVNLRLDGVVYDVFVGGPADAMTVASGAHRAVASVTSERDRGRRRGRGAKGAGELLAPMPGRILQVSAKTGATVAVGDPLVVIEAMKMENELRAEIAGVVTAVEVTVGQNVESGALLVRIEAAAE